MFSLGQFWLEKIGKSGNSVKTVRLEFSELRMLTRYCLGSQKLTPLIGNVTVTFIIPEKGEKNKR